MKKKIWATFLRMGDKHYCYDVGTNNLLEITELHHHILKTYNYTNRAEVMETFRGTYPPREILGTLREIDEFHQREGGFILQREMKSRFPFAPREYEQLSKHLVNQVILNITEECNFRCRYCTFSGKYPSFRRHGQKSMPWSILKKSVDFLVANSKFILEETQKDLHLGFYGGEALLESEKIFRTVAYIAKRYGDIFPRFQFSLTTNGSRFNRQNIRKFIEYGFVLHVSLNGPKDIHDAYRISKDGGGTHDLIVEKLRSIQKMDRRFFEQNVGFSVVFCPQFQVQSVIEYFRRSFSRNRFFTASLVELEDTKLFRALDMGKELREYDSDLRRLKKEYFLAKRAKEDDEILYSLFEKPLAVLHRRPLHALGEEMFPSGPCLPGLDKVFVDTEGNLHLCEKINWNFPIGHVDEGLDTARIFQLIEGYLRCADGCKGCWAFRLCDDCFLSCVKGRNFSREKKQAFCKVERKRLKSDMRDYLRVLQENPRAFDGQSLGDGEEDLFRLALAFLRSHPKSPSRGSPQGRFKSPPIRP